MLRNERFEILAGDTLDTPERKTRGTINGIQQFHLIDLQRDDQVTGTRWVELTLPR